MLSFEGFEEKKGHPLACPEQFEYLKALQAGLPIGSGQIESAHWYVIKERMNISGAWWTIENASDMIGLRTLRTTWHVG